MASPNRYPYFYQSQQNPNVTRQLYPNHFNPQSVNYGQEVIRGQGQFLGHQQIIMNDFMGMPSRQYNTSKMVSNQTGYFQRLPPQQANISFCIGNKPVFIGDQATCQQPTSSQDHGQRKYDQPHILSIIDPTSGKDVTEEIIKGTQNSNIFTGPTSSQEHGQRQYDQPQKMKRHILSIIDPSSGKDVTEEVMKGTQHSNISGSSDTEPGSTLTDSKSLSADDLAAQLPASKLNNPPHEENPSNRTFSSEHLQVNPRLSKRGPLLTTEVKQHSKSKVPQYQVDHKLDMEKPNKVSVQRNQKAKSEKKDGFPDNLSRPTSSQEHGQRQYDQPQKMKKHILSIIDPISGKDVTEEVMKGTQNSNFSGSSDTEPRSTLTEPKSLSGNDLAAQFGALVATKIYHPPHEENPSYRTFPSEQLQVNPRLSKRGPLLTTEVKKHSKSKVPQYQVEHKLDMENPNKVSVQRNQKAKSQNEDGFPDSLSEQRRRRIEENLNTRSGKRKKRHREVSENDGGSNLQEGNVPDVFENNPYSLRLYTEAISKGVEKDSTIRVNVVGNYGQGKTTLTKRLILETIEGVESTNSVEINRCKCDYMQDELTFSAIKQMNDDDDIIERIASVASLGVMKDSHKERHHLHENSVFTEIRSCSIYSDFEKKEDLNKNIKTKEKNCRQQFDIKAQKTNEMVLQGDQSICSPELKQEQCRIERSISQTEQKMFTMLLQNNHNKYAQSRDMAIWDFGGQYSFYATHNLFHSRQAVYLLVFDLSKPLNSVVKDSEFPDRAEEKTIEQYAKFWMNSIHAYVGSDDGREPPVILVGTHKDKLEGNEEEKQVFIEEYFEQIRKMFENTNMIKHIQPEDYAVDNTNPNDDRIVELRKEVIQQGTKLAEISIPAKWIPLERAVRRHRHKKIISFKELMDIDSRNEIPLKEQEQVKLFLRYHHSKGTLLFYDEESISAYVVLDSQYLIDAFKCIITSERFCRRDHICRKLWKSLTKEARLENELIEELWKQDTNNDFLTHKKELLMILAQHLIISEASVYNEETQKSHGLGWYIVPSLLRSNSTEDVLTDFLTGRRRTSVRFVMSFYQSPLVQVLFYRLLAALIGKWPIVQIPLPRVKKTLIYENLGVFQLDDNHVGIVVHKNSDIDLWVLTLCPSLNVESKFADKFRRFSEAIVKNEFVKFRHSRTQQEHPYIACITCNHESHGPMGGIGKVPFVDLRRNTRGIVACPDKRNHELFPDQILLEWFLEDKITLLCPDHQVTDKELSKIALAIGTNWEFLGLELGLQVSQIQRIAMDKNTPEMQIYTMLLEWKAQKEDGATIDALIQAIETEKRVHVEWDNIRNLTDKINSERLEN